MKKQVWNSATSLILQFVTIAVGLILPRLMIQAFGSAANGLVSSLTQFLSYVTLFEGGIGAVVRAALYKKFALKDDNAVSAVLKATEKFYQKLCIGFVGYALILLVIYPTFINKSFDWLYTGSMLLIILAGQIFQYCFGITYSILLQADNKQYVPNIAGIITVFLNAIVSIYLINIGASIHIVKLVSACVFMLRPLIYQVYVRKHYNLNRKCGPDNESLRQRNNAMAHHIAFFLHTNTDIAVITIFSTLGNVSVYSIYYLVASCMTKLVSAVFSGAEAYLGNYLAKNGEDATAKKFDYYTMAMNSFIIVIFFTAESMLMPFIKLYTAGIHDANYMVPTLGYMLLLSEMIYSLRLPYNHMIITAGHFKQTQRGAIIEASTNIILSVILINIMGLPGVAIATAIAMGYRTIYYLWYLSKNIIHLSLQTNLLRVMGCLVIIGLGVLCKCLFFKSGAGNYGIWIAQSVICAMVGIMMAGIYDSIFFRGELKSILNTLKYKACKH